MSVEERVAIVTGASSGIGAACARALAAEGVKVALTYAGNTEGAEAVAADCEAAGSSALVLKADVGTDGDCQATAKATLDA